MTMSESENECAYVLVLNVWGICMTSFYLQGKSLRHANAPPCDCTHCIKSISTFAYRHDLSLCYHFEQWKTTRLVLVTGQQAQRLT